MSSSVDAIPILECKKALDFIVKGFFVGGMNQVV